MRSSPRVTRKSMIDRAEESSTSFAYGTYLLVLFSFVSIVAIAYFGRAEIFDYKIKNVDVVEKLTTKNVDFSGDLNITGTVYDKGSIQVIDADENQNFTSLPPGNHTILINTSLADGRTISLPESTTANGGMEIKIIYAVASEGAVSIGFATTTFTAGATVFGGSDASNATANNVTSISSNKKFIIDPTNPAQCGGAPGSVITFSYVGEPNQVIANAQLITTIVPNANLPGLLSTSSI